MPITETLKVISPKWEEEIQMHIHIVESFLKYSRCMTRCKCPAKKDALKSMQWLEDFFKTD